MAEHLMAFKLLLAITIIGDIAKSALFGFMRLVLGEVVRLIFLIGIIIFEIHVGKVIVEE